MATDSVSKIKMIQLGLTPYYDVIAKQAENFKLVMPKDAEVARCFVQYAQSAMSMAEISNELQAFLQNGRLNPNVPDGSRMVRSTKLIGTFFQSLKKNSRMSQVMWLLKRSHALRSSFHTGKPAVPHSHRSSSHRLKRGSSQTCSLTNSFRPYCVFSCVVCIFNGESSLINMLFEHCVRHRTAIWHSPPILRLRCPSDSTITRRQTSQPLWTCRPSLNGHCKRN
mgnify:CR=1 FL=1